MSEFLEVAATAETPDQQTAIPIISVTPTGYDFGPSQIQGHDNLILYFGDSALGIAIPRDRMAGLGQQLIALGVQGPRQ